jgi:hypothetical protein
LIGWPGYWKEMRKTGTRDVPTISSAYAKKGQMEGLYFSNEGRFTDVLLEEKYLDELHNQVYDGNIQAYLTKWIT